MCWAAAFTSLADTTEIGPGVGMPLADGLSQEYTAESQGPYTKVNGQYVDSEGNIIQGAILIVAIGLKAISYYRNGGDRA